MWDGVEAFDQITFNHPGDTASVGLCQMSQCLYGIAMRSKTVGAVAEDGFIEVL